MADKVSVIMPAYNAEGFVEDAVRSVLAQTHGAIELIAVDDGSTDRTRSVLARLAREDSRVSLLCCEVNGGPGTARNHALAAASGKWIALLDADDIYARDHLETLLRTARAHDYDMVAGNQILRDYPENRPIGLAFPGLTEPRELTVEELVTSGTGRGAALSFGYLKPLIRRDFLAAHRIRYDERHRVGEDFLFYFDCMRRNARCLLIPHASYIYRRRSDSLTFSSPSNYRTLSDLMSQMIDCVEQAMSAELVALLHQRKRYLEQQLEYSETVSLFRQRQLFQVTRRVLANPRIGARLAERAIARMSARPRRAARM